MAPNSREEKTVKDKKTTTTTTLKNQNKTQKQKKNKHCYIVFTGNLLIWQNLWENLSNKIQIQPAPKS